MLGAISGGDPFEIIVSLRDLTAAGFGKLRAEIGATERAASGANLSGFSKQAKNLEKDAAAAAGKGGIGGLAGGLMSLAGGPVGLAVAGIAAVAGAGIELTKTYEGIEVQEKALAIAAKGHGIALDALNKFVDESITANEAYGVGATDTRSIITKLTEAGMSLADQQQAMGPILDMAKAKGISAADAAKVYELAIMGNARALKEFGIALPKVTSAQVDVDKAQKVVTVSTNNLRSAQDKLKLLQDQLAGKTRLTAADQDRLKIAQDRVKTATDALQTAQTKLTAAQAKANEVGGRSKIVNDAITKAVGDQRNAVSPLQVAQAKLGDTWQKLATAVGPPLLAFFGAVLSRIAAMVSALADFIAWLGRAGDAVRRSPVGGFLKTVSTPAKGGGLLKGSDAAALKTLGSSVGVAGGVNTLLSFFGVSGFAHGGVVSRPTLALIGEGGEREYVIPESRMGSAGGGSSTFHVHLNLSGQQIAEVVGRIHGTQLALAGTSSMFD